MTNSSKPVSSGRKRLLAAVASVAIAGAVGLSAVTSGTVPVFAEAVRVEAPQAPSFADVVERVSPAVVSVHVKAKIEPASDADVQMFGRGFEDLPDDHPMKRFFRNSAAMATRTAARVPSAASAVTTGRGRSHRVPASSSPRTAISSPTTTSSKAAPTFTVVIDSGKELDAKLVGTDPRTDLAVLKVDPDGTKFTYVDFADDAKVRVGDWVVAVGNPFGLGGTVTAGIVSARGRDIGAGPYDDFLQIDAAVNRGNSGGPAFNLNGEVVGINTAIFSPSGGNVGIAFAIPASTAREVVQDLIKDGSGAARLARRSRSSR